MCFQMRIFQIALTYREHMERFYANRPEFLCNSSFTEIQQALYADAFNALHLYAQDMPELGHETFVAVPNDPITQHRWRNEHAPHLKRAATKELPPPGGYGKFLTDDLVEILIEQVDRFEPDVIYLQDPVGFDSRFLRMLKKRPRLVIGWRAANIPPSVDWRDIDLLVSNHQPSLRKAKKLGIRWQEHLLPGFPAWIAEKLGSQEPETDVVFSGYVSFEHKARMRALARLAEASRRGDRDRPLSIEYYVNRDPALPQSIVEHTRQQLWGLAMFSGFRRGRVALNIHIDLAKRQASNMRLFEATGVGAFLLTDYKPNIAEYFEPGSEVETFRSPGEMLEKIEYYLDRPEERRAIAEAGQRKTLAKFTRMHSSVRLEGLIQRALKAKALGPARGGRLTRWFHQGLESIPSVA